MRCAGAISDTRTELMNVQAALVHVSNFTDIIDSIDQVRSVRTCSISGDETHVNDVAPPSCAQLRNVAGVLSCMADLVAQLNGVDAAVVALPASLSNLSSIVGRMNASLAPALVQMDSAVLMLDGISANVSAFNMSGRVDELNNLDAGIQLAIRSVNVGAMLNATANLDARVAGAMVSITSASLHLSEFLGNCSGAAISPGAVADLRSFEARVREPLSRTLGNATDRLAGYYMSGICSNNVLVMCTDDASCGGGTCDVRVMHCECVAPAAQEGAHY